MSLSKGSDPADDQDFVGGGLAVAEALAAQRSLRLRVICIDGQYLPATRDYRTDRVNCTLESGLIVKVNRG